MSRYAAFDSVSQWKISQNKLDISKKSTAVTFSQKKIQEQGILPECNWYECNVGYVTIFINKQE